MGKRLSVVSIIGVLLVMLTGCSKSVDYYVDRYYIKYEVDVNSNYTGDISYITVNTNYGELSLNSGRYFSETFGPVKYGFPARICVYTSAYQADVTIRIYASRGGEAFALKKIITVQNPTIQYPAVLEYFIDF